MNEMAHLTLALLAGLTLGAIFFGGLWWTVRRSMSAQNPAAWIFGSLILRMSAAMAGLYFVGRGDWTRLVACLVGFILARIVVMRLMPAREKTMLRQPEANHAPES